MTSEPDGLGGWEAVGKPTIRFADLPSELPARQRVQHDERQLWQQLRVHANGTPPRGLGAAAVGERATGDFAIARGWCRG